MQTPGSHEHSVSAFKGIPHSHFLSSSILFFLFTAAHAVSVLLADHGQSDSYNDYRPNDSPSAGGNVSQVLEKEDRSDYNQGDS